MMLPQRRSGGVVATVTTVGPTAVAFVFAIRLVFAIGFAFVPAGVSAQGARALPVDVKVVPELVATKTGAMASTTVAAGEKYRAGAARRWFLGDTYRDLWTASMQVPFLDLDTFAGGLKPLKAGGGMQTKSLRLVTKDGIEYVFRCVQKDHAWSVPDQFKGSVVERVSRDQVSTSHPGAALVAAPLLEAAGVLHATPVFVVMPEDAPLGEFAKDFAGQLGIIEAYPPKAEHGDGFAEVGQHGRRLQPNIAAANDHDVGHARHLGHHPINIGAGTDAMDAGQIVAGAGEAVRAAAGRPDQRAIAERRAVGERDAVRLGIDGDDSPVEQQIDIPFAPEGIGADQDTLEALFARQIFLGQRRALVGRLGFVAKQCDGAGELLLAKHQRRLRAAMPGTHDQHVVSVHFELLPSIFH